MARENFTNFATTALVTPNPLTSGGSSFTVTGGQGALYPTANFIISMDSELMFISSRSTDTFTIQTRGYDGTTAASHNAGAIIQLPVCAYNINHIWQNVADTYVPQVPPVQLGNSAGTIDNEFESLGSWTLNPSFPSGSTVWNAGSTLKSHLLFARQLNGDTGRYTAYTSFSPGGAFTVTAKLSHSINVDYSNSWTARLTFFVSDQSIPTSGPNSGNNVRIETILTAFAWTPSAPDWPVKASFVRYATTISGSGSAGAPNLPYAPGLPMFLRITNDGSGHWTCLYGDGIAYWQLVQSLSSGFTPQSCGFIFEVTGSGGNLAHVAAIDYVRSASSVLPPYGN